MEEKSLTLLIYPLGIILSFFIPFMTIAGQSSGCRFQEIRLPVVLEQTGVSIFCVLHPIEIVLTLSGLAIYLLGAYLAITKRKLDLVAPYQLILYSLLFFVIPILDMVYVGFYPGRIGYLTYGFNFGFLIYFVSFVAIGISGWLRYQEYMDT